MFDASGTFSCQRDVLFRAAAARRRGSVKQKHPGWTPEQVKAASPRPPPAHGWKIGAWSAHARGSGDIDLAAAGPSSPRLPTSASFGRAALETTPRRSRKRSRSTTLLRDVTYRSRCRRRRDTPLSCLRSNGERDARTRERRSVVLRLSIGAQDSRRRRPTRRIALRVGRPDDDPRGYLSTLLDPHVGGGSSPRLIGRSTPIK